MVFKFAVYHNKGIQCKGFPKCSVLDKVQKHLGIKTTNLNIVLKNFAVSSLQQKHLLTCKCVLFVHRAVFSGGTLYLIDLLMDRQTDPVQKVMWIA